jgi:hypothetical protein
LNATLSLEIFLPPKGMGTCIIPICVKVIFFIEEFQDINRVGGGSRNCTKPLLGINLGINIDNECHQKIKCPGYYHCWVVLALFMRTIRLGSSQHFREPTRFFPLNLDLQ